MADDPCRRPGTDVRSPLHVVAYTDVVLHMLCTGCPRESTARAHAVAHRTVHRREPGRSRRCTARSAATPTAASSTSRAADDGTADPPPPAVPGVRPPVHHGRDREPDRGQALRRHRAVQPRQGARRRPQGLPGPAGHRGRPGAARPAGRGGGPGHRRRRDRGPRGRPGRPRRRCASSTRSPTCGSRSVYRGVRLPRGLRGRDRAAARRARARQRRAATPTAQQHAAKHRRTSGTTLSDQHPARLPARRKHAAPRRRCTDQARTRTHDGDVERAAATTAPAAGQSRRAQGARV